MSWRIGEHLVNKAVDSNFGVISDCQLITNTFITVSFLKLIRQMLHSCRISVTTHLLQWYFKHGWSFGRLCNAHVDLSLRFTLCDVISMNFGTSYCTMFLTAQVLLPFQMFVMQNNLNHSILSWHIQVIYLRWNRWLPKKKKEIFFEINCSSYSKSKYTSDWAELSITYFFSIFFDTSYCVESGVKTG